MIYVIIYLALQLISLGLVIGKHGDPKEGTWNAWGYLIAVSVDLWLLYKAGLFNELISAL